MVAPGIVIATTASGTGKTTISTGLMRALSCRHAVAPFKTEPDYINPGYHGVAAGHPGRNLDSFMCSPEMIGPLYARGAADSGIAVVESAVGFFDGRIGDDPLSVVGSAVEIASLLGLSVVLVIGTRHMSQSATAVVHGFSTFHTDVHVNGVIINQVGSPRRADTTTRSVEAMGAEVLGTIPRVTDIEMPSRCLGLVAAVEQGEQLETVIESMTNLVEAYVDIDQITQLARQPYPTEPWSPTQFITPLATQCRMRVAVAVGPAFSFTYAKHRELLRATGAEVVGFNPLVDKLPEAEGYIVSGGFPEEYADALPARDDIRRDLRQTAGNDTLIHGECTKLLWPFEDFGGCRMCGIIPGRAHMARLRLGYQEAVTLTDSTLCPVGTRAYGHGFRKTALTDDTASVATAVGW